MTIVNRSPMFMATAPGAPGVAIDASLYGGDVFFVNSGTGSGQLVLVTNNDGTDYTLKAAPATALVAADSTLTKILVLGQSLHVLKSTRDKLISTAAAGTARLNTIYSEVKFLGSSGWERLLGSKHSALNLTGKAPAFRSIVMPADGWFAPLA